MPRVRLYIALSLDGYIADRNGGVGWLDNNVDAAEGDYGYAEFYASVAALAMGRTTYEQVLGFGEWPYDKPTYVFSHDPPEGEHPHATFVTDPAGFVADAPWGEGDPGSGPRQALWLVGGGKLVAAFRAADLIDEYVLTVLPVLLGDGLPLFPGEQPQASLQLEEVQHWPSGVVQLLYGRR